MRYADARSGVGRWAPPAPIGKNQHAWEGEPPTQIKAPTTHELFDTLERELALIKVAATRETRSELGELAEMYRARVVDVSSDSMIVEITGDHFFGGALDGAADLLGDATEFGVDPGGSLLDEPHRTDHRPTHPLLADAEVLQ